MRGAISLSSVVMHAVCCYTCCRHSQLHPFTHLEITCRRILSGSTMAVLRDPCGPGGGSSDSLRMLLDSEHHRLQSRSPTETPELPRKAGHMGAETPDFVHEIGIVKVESRFGGILPRLTPQAPVGRSAREWCLRLRLDTRKRTEAERWSSKQRDRAQCPLSLLQTCESGSCDASYASCDRRCPLCLLEVQGQSTQRQELGTKCPC